MKLIDNIFIQAYVYIHKYTINAKGEEIIFNRICI